MLDLDYSRESQDNPDIIIADIGNPGRIRWRAYRNAISIDLPSEYSQNEINQLYHNETYSISYLLLIKNFKRSASKKVLCKFKLTTPLLIATILTVGR